MKLKHARFDRHTPQVTQEVQPKKSGKSPNRSTRHRPRVRLLRQQLVQVCTIFDLDHCITGILLKNAGVKDGSLLGTFQNQRLSTSPVVGVSAVGIALDAALQSGLSEFELGSEGGRGRGGGAWTKHMLLTKHAMKLPNQLRTHGRDPQMPPQLPTSRQTA